MEDDFVFFGSRSLGAALYYEALREEAARIAAGKKEKKQDKNANKFPEVDYRDINNGPLKR